MKVIKRDGKMVEYDKEKIIIAIGKANNEIPEEFRASEAEIKKIVKYIESLNKKRILVEDIQDIIEMKLMEAKKYELAKHYIVYRYNRALVRKSNTTDDSLLSIIRNGRLGSVDSSLPSTKASYQREYIAKEVSRDLTRRLLLPEKIVKSHEDGIIYFHDAEYFMQPIFDASLINIKNMFEEETIINDKSIPKPNNFIEACIILTEIISNALSNQYGGISLDISFLGKYIKASESLIKQKYKRVKDDIDKEDIVSLIETDLMTEIKAGIKLINYQINSLMDSRELTHDISFLININNDDPELKYNLILYQELINFKKDNANSLPRLFYVLNSLTRDKSSKYYNLTDIVIKCALKGDKITFINEEAWINKYNKVYAPLGNYKLLDIIKNNQYDGRFTQGIVSINLAQIAILADGDEEVLYKELEERLLICKEALLCRYHSLSGCTSSISPIHWQNGAIARLSKTDKVDEYLRNNYSPLLLGYVGLSELVKSMIGYDINSLIGSSYAIKILNKINDYLNKWSKESNISILLFNVIENNIRTSLFNTDLEHFGKVKHITDKFTYDKNFVINNLNEIDNINDISVLNNGGSLIFINKKLFMNNELNSFKKILYFEIEEDDENE